MNTREHIEEKWEAWQHCVKLCGLSSNSYSIEMIEGLSCSF